ncbi:MAG: GGDEF domain-containing protein [Acidobacteriota bacterium]
MSSSAQPNESPPFSGFSPEEVAAICTAGEAQRYGAGEILFQRDEYGDSMFVLEEGSVELTFADGVSGKQLGAGDVFGELAFVTGRHLRSATARTTSPCLMRVIDEAAFDRLYQDQPRLLVRLLRHTCGYLLASENRLIESLTRKNRELESTLDYLRRTREEVDYQELLANTDELTGLYNRRCLDRQLDKFIERAHATGTGLALILVDVDEFKSVNDTHGHAIGDAVLRALGSIITDCVRSSDLPCRFGGDEFAIVLTEIDPQRAVDRAERIRAHAERLRAVPSRPDLRTSTSVGGAMLRAQDSAASLFDRADKELYRAKELGRNQVSWQGRAIPHRAASSARSAATPP